MRITECTKCDCLKCWDGDSILCPFQDSESFGDNWNCGLIQDIRELHLLTEGTEPDKRVHHQYCDDEHYLTIKTDNIEDMGLCLWLSWYKSRGRTKSMWFMYSEGPPKQPTFTQLQEILNHYTKS